MKEFAVIDTDHQHRANQCLQHDPLQRITTGSAPLRAFLHASEAAGPAAALRRLRELCAGQSAEVHGSALAGFRNEYGRRLAAANVMPRAKRDDPAWSHYDQLGSDIKGSLSAPRLAALARHAVEEQALTVHLQVASYETDPVHAMDAMIRELDRLTRVAYERWRKLVAAHTHEAPRAATHPVFPVLRYTTPDGPSSASQLWVMPVGSVPMVAWEHYRLSGVFEPRRELYDARVIRSERNWR